MFLSSNALSLLRNNATSICSRLTFSGLYSLAIFDSVSPRCTVYVSPPPAFGPAAVGSARASCSARRSGLGADRRNRLDSLRYCGPRRIEQERVIADDTPRRPVHF